MLSPWWTIAAAGALLLVFLESLQVHIYIRVVDEIKEEFLHAKRDLKKTKNNFV